MFDAGLSLTMADAPRALAEGLRALEAGETMFDLARVETLDSAAVALLLAWQRAARARGAVIEFHRLPPALCSLAGLYGVTELLTLISAAQQNQERH
ncbi:MAG: anti-anti-sigma regulatory factor [Burkholderiaceae bacterium]|nr:anti-anti-sigma regulatory factor [Burkholderiaceae bacterium]